MSKLEDVSHKFVFVFVSLAKLCVCVSVFDNLVSG